MGIRTIAYIDCPDGQDHTGDTARITDEWKVLVMQSVSEIDGNEPPDLIIVRHPLAAHAGVIELVRSLRHKCLAVFHFSLGERNTTIQNQDGIDVRTLIGDSLTPGFIMGIEKNTLQQTLQRNQSPPID